MTVNSKTTNAVSLLDKHIITAISVLMIGLMGWIGMSVTESRESIVALQIETRNMISLVGDLKDEMREIRADRYTKTDALRYKKDTDIKFDGLRSRIENLEKKIYTD